MIQFVLYLFYSYHILYIIAPFNYIYEHMLQVSNQLRNQSMINQSILMLWVIYTLLKQARNPETSIERAPWHLLN